MSTETVIEGHGGLRQREGWGGNGAPKEGWDDIEPTTGGVSRTNTAV